MSSIFKGSSYRQSNDVEAGSNRSSHFDDEDQDFSAVPFDITSTKNAPIDCLHYWRYYLKARFHFKKDQFADLMVITGVAGTISQLLLMPILAPVLREERLLSIGLFFNCAHMIFYSIAWSFWVPYTTTVFSLFYVFSQPCLQSIISKQVGPCEQVGYSSLTQIGITDDLGLSIAEAAAYGLPIVSTKNGSPVDIHRVLYNGLFVDPHDH